MWGGIFKLSEFGAAMMHFHGDFFLYLVLAGVIDYIGD